MHARVSVCVLWTSMCAQLSGVEEKCLQTKTRWRHDSIHYTPKKGSWLKPFIANNEVNRIRLFWCKPQFRFLSHLTSRKERTNEGEMGKYQQVKWDYNSTLNYLHPDRFEISLTSCSRAFPSQLFHFILHKSCHLVMDFIWFLLCYFFFPDKQSNHYPSRRRIYNLRGHLQVFCVFLHHGSLDCLFLLHYHSVYRSVNTSFLFDRPCLISPRIPLTLSPKHFIAGPLSPFVPFL